MVTEFRFNSNFVVTELRFHKHNAIRTGLAGMKDILYVFRSVIPLRWFKYWYIEKKAVTRHIQCCVSISGLSSRKSEASSFPDPYPAAG